MSAPSFSSFPPSFSSFPDLEASSSSRRADEKARGGSSSAHSTQKDSSRTANKKSEEERKKSGKKRDKERDKERRKDSTRDKHREGDRSDAHHRPSRKTTEGGKDYLDDERGPRDSETRSKLFFSDHKGDSLNVAYGGLHSGDVPKYSFINRGRDILGLRNAYVFKREGRGIFLEDRLTGRSKAPQLSDKRTRKTLEASVVRRLKPSAKAKAVYEESDGFIRISDDTSAKAESSDQLYCSITEHDEDSSSDSSDESSRDSEPESDPDTIALSAREEALRRLEFEIKEDPSSTPAWLSLLEHTLASTMKSRKDSDTARQEITVSVLNRAMNAHPNNRRSPLLTLKLMKAGEYIWDNSKLHSEWETALKMVKHPDVWMDWLDWRLRKCPQGLEGCVQDVQRVRDSGAIGLEDYDADILNLRIFWRLAVFFKQTGYVERGMSIFQAQAELTFNTPDTMKSAPFGTRLEALGDFWESEVPRVSESDAKGWSTWNPNKEVEHYASRAINRDNPRPLDADQYTRWASSERDDDPRRHLPLRSTEEDDEDDPYRTILFADIGSFLFPIRTKAGKNLFRLVWLHYIGMRIPGLVNHLSSLPLDERWAEENFASSASLSFLVKEDGNRYLAIQDSYAGALVGREKRYRKAFHMVKEWGFEARDPFDYIGLDGTGRQWELFSGNEDLVRSIFKQLQLDGDHTWSRLWLAFEAAVNLKGAAKVSKSLLAINQSSPHLWSAHAHVERLRGRFDEARKVYQTILASLPPNSSERALICWDFAEMEWLLGKSQSARDVVFMAADQQNSKGDIQILRTKRVLVDFCRSHQTPENWKTRVAWIKLRGLLDLLSGSLDGALDLFDESIAQEAPLSPCHEHLGVSSLVLLYHHTVTLKNPAPRILLRSRIGNMLDIYPTNTVILGLFLECEKGEGVWGRVRELLGEKKLTQLGAKSLLRRVAEVWISGWEEDRWKGEVERVKAGLEMALRCDETRGSSVIWRILLEVEIKYGSHKNAKTILFRALGECPMVKELYLLAFGPLRKEFSSRELHNLADTMAEKGIRLRRSLDEVVNVDEGGSDGEIEDEPANELEYNSRELRRLMPY